MQGAPQGNLSTQLVRLVPEYPTLHRMGHEIEHACLHMIQLSIQQRSPSISLHTTKQLAFRAHTKILRLLAPTRALEQLWMCSKRSTNGFLRRGTSPKASMMFRRLSITSLRLGILSQQVRASSLSVDILQNRHSSTSETRGYPSVFFLSWRFLLIASHSARSRLCINNTRETTKSGQAIL